MPRFRQGDALVLVDVQNDFLPGGTLAVPRGDEVVPILSEYTAAATRAGVPVFATRDWHPADHCSFRERGGPWPRHCVAGTHGAAFSSALRRPDSWVVISKALERDRDAYSGFDGTDLDARLRAQGVTRLFIGGLATDYCVFRTVADARRRGYEVVVLYDAIRAVDVRPGDGARAIGEMTRLGARLSSQAEELRAEHRA